MVFGSTTDTTSVDLGPLHQYIKPTVTNLGIKMDRELKLESQIKSVVKTSFYHLRQLDKVKPFLSRQQFETVIHAFVTTRLDYCNSLYMGSCSSVECWQIQCDVGTLERGASVILTLRSRLWAETFIERVYKQFVLECSVHYKVDKMPYSIPPTFKPSGSKKVVMAVMWNKPDTPFPVPVWIIILAILAGLLLLALLIYLLYKMGFFKRSDPYGTTMEKAQLKPQASSEA
nr:integrin alpha-5-like [Pseudochaenichthys georgianus]